MKANRNSMRERSVMRTLTISLTDEAYQAIRTALRNHPQINDHSVTNWIETELNDNTDTIIEMLLSEF